MLLLLEFRMLKLENGQKFETSLGYMSRLVSENKGARDIASGVKKLAAKPSNLNPNPGIQPHSGRRMDSYKLSSELTCHRHAAAQEHKENT